MTFLRTFTIAALAAATVVAAPVAAITYDAASSFNGTTNPSGVFTYGQTNGTTFTPFTAFSDCEPGLRCLLSSDEPALGVYKNTTGAAFTAFTTVDVPAGALFLHPGPTSQAYLMFTSPTAKHYDVTIFAGLLSNSTITGVTVGSGFIVGGILIPSGSLSLTQSLPTVSFSGPLFIDAGDSIFLTIGNAGDFRFDSTQIDLTLIAVPEPATWALLITGFGLTGAALRRRRAVATTA